MIDFHSHILPCIDDGSKSVEESIKMLRLLKEQKVSTVVATPHFYANHHSVGQFLSKREASFIKISHLINDNLPRVILGAEVKYYEGISRLDNLKKLCIGDTNLLLLEMPMKRWTEYILREVRQLNSFGNIRVVIAHIDRYVSFQSKDTIDTLIEDGILIQANTEFFLNFRTRRKAVKMLRSGLIHFIGTDCHNLKTRKPDMDDALSYIKRKCSDDFVQQFESECKRFLYNAYN